MSYATQADLELRFGSREIEQLTDHEGVGAINSERVDAALADADSLIDSYLARRVALPLDPVPAVLKRIACDLARYFLQEDGAVEEAESRYKAAVQYLRDVAQGKVALGADAPQPTALGEPLIHRGERRFGDDDLEGF